MIRIVLPVPPQGRTDIPPYCDALPHGERVALMPGLHLDTHRGTVPLPDGDNPLFDCITAASGFQIAGQSHSFAGVTWHWHHDAWHRLPYTAVGVNPVIFDRAGALHISSGAVGSQGYRYADEAGHLITGDATYGAVENLYQWTLLGGVRAGQLGYNAGVTYRGVTRILEPGEAQVVRFSRDGHKLAFAVTQPRHAVLIWCDLDELETLPLWTPDAPAPPLDPPPSPETPTVEIPDYSGFVRDFLTPRLRRFEGDHERTRAHSFEQLNACAAELHRRDPRVGLLEKKGGARVRDRAADIIAYDLGNGTCQLFDAITDGEGEDGVPRPGWREVPEEHAGLRPIDQWRRPYETAIPVPDPDVPPPPVPEPTPPDPQPGPHPAPMLVDLRPALAPLMFRLELLARRIDQLEARAPGGGPSDALRSGDTVTLATASGAVLTVVGGESIGTNDQRVELRTREAGSEGSWERLTVKRV